MPLFLFGTGAVQVEPDYYYYSLTGGGAPGALCANEEVMFR